LFGYPKRHPELPPFDVRKAENNLQKTENDRSFIAEKQKKSRKYVFDLLSINFSLPCIIIIR
jgi:hypothetical protein